MIFNTREVAERQAREAKLAREKQFRSSIDQLNQKTDEMGGKHCPLVGKNCILGSCVHFYPGYVVKNVIPEPPGCKLWK